MEILSIIGIIALIILLFVGGIIYFVFAEKIYFATWYRKIKKSPILHPI